MSRLHAFVKDNLKLLLVVAVAVMVANAGPAMARRVFDAANADKVDGYDAAQLSSTTYASSTTQVDGFDGCDFQPIFTTTVTAPHAGYLTVTSTVAAARDVDSTADAVLTTRLLIGSRVISVKASTNLSAIGSQDTTNVNLGGSKVRKGAHTLTIEGEECTDGQAYVVNAQLATTFSPFGSVTVE